MTDMMKIIMNKVADDITEDTFIIDGKYSYVRRRFVTLHGERYLHEEIEDVNTRDVKQRLYKLKLLDEVVDLNA